MLRQRIDASNHHSGAARKSPREAGRAFVRDATLGWGKHELGDWLVCHYAPSVMAPDTDVNRTPSVRHVVDHQSAVAIEARRASGQPTAIDECSIVEIVCAARSRALRVLEQLSHRTHAEAVSRLALVRGLVAAVRDDRGAIAHLPIDLARMRLADRVASLFVADYLNAPFEYHSMRSGADAAAESPLRVCRGCGGIAYGSAVAHGRGCPSEARESRVATCERESSPEVSPLTTRRASA